MSRAKKQLKSRRRRQRGGHARGAGPTRRGADDARKLTFESYSIVETPLRLSDQTDPAVWEGMSEHERQRIHDDLQDDPAAAVARIEPILARHPNSPTLLNWLAAAYSSLGRIDKYEEVARLNYERNPDYLFARVNWAEVCFRHGDLDAVRDVFENKFDLKLMYPHRDVFHLSEFVAFASIVVPYLDETGEREAARNLFDVMNKIAPDHPATESVRRFFAHSILQRALARIRRQLTRHSEARPGRIGC